MSTAFSMRSEVFLLHFLRLNVCPCSEMTVFLPFNLRDTGCYMFFIVLSVWCEDRKRVKSDDSIFKFRQLISHFCAVKLEILNNHLESHWNQWQNALESNRSVSE